MFTFTRIFFLFLTSIFNGYFLKRKSFHISTMVLNMTKILLKVTFHCHKPYYPFFFVCFSVPIFSAFLPVIPGIKPNVPQEQWKQFHWLPFKSILFAGLCTVQFCTAAPQHTVLTLAVNWEHMGPFGDSLYTPEQLFWILGGCKVDIFFPSYPWHGMMKTSSSLMFTGLQKSFLLCSPWCPPGTRTRVYFINK